MTDVVRAQKKPVIVEARKAHGRQKVYTANGVAVAEDGDYILTDPNTGDSWPVKHDIFLDTYVIVDESKVKGEHPGEIGLGFVV